MEATSSFNLTTFQSQLIPKENRPLEVGLLRKVKELLSEVDARTLARHVTKVDCLVSVRNPHRRDNTFMALGSGVKQDGEGLIPKSPGYYEASGLGLTSQVSLLVLGLWVSHPASQPPFSQFRSFCFVFLESHYVALVRLELAE